MQRIAFMTLGVLKQPIGDPEVQGFVDHPVQKRIRISARTFVIGVIIARESQRAIRR
jgi:hypothetical protein